MPPSPIDRRGALGLLAAGGAVTLAGVGAAGASRAGTGDPGGLVVGSARGADGRDRAVVCDASGRVLLETVLPDRGHGPSLSPDGRWAVMPARRPGTFAAVLDLAAMRPAGMIESPHGRHFMGHGLFLPDNRTWIAVENDFEAGRGTLGFWDIPTKRRLRELPSDGIGPHQLLLDPGEASVTVANGGILTHPDHARAKLNIPTMRPTMRRLALADGAVLDGADLPDAWHKVSLRHIDMGPDGRVLIGGQDEGPRGNGAPLLFQWDAAGGPLRPIDLPAAVARGLDQYIGSVAIDRTGRIGAAASPRGGVALVLDLDAGSLIDTVRVPDGCGLARDGDADGRFFLSSGTGRLDRLALDPTGLVRRTAIAGPSQAAAMWDNHLGTVG